MAHGDVTVAFFDFLSENHDYTVFYSTEWPPYRQNPIFYSVFGGPSRPEVHAPEGQNPRKVAFFSEKDGILISSINLNNLCNQSILLHEIIHSFQNDLNIENAYKEMEAYQLQNKFLEELSIKNDMIDILNIKKFISNQLNEFF